MKLFYEFMKKNLPLLLVLAFLLPTIIFGYTADDRQWVLSAQLIDKFNSINLIDKLLNAMHSLDRFFPISIALLVTSFHFFDYTNSWAYHLIIIMLNITAFLIFMKWVDEFFNLPNKLWLILLLLASTQFRLTYNDPIVSNFGMLQTLAILFF